MSGFELDHVVLAVPDLSRGCERFADSTGCRPVDGGPHEAMGTRNALVAFSPGRYLELIGPDADRASERSFGGRLARAAREQLLGWALRTSDLPGCIDAASRRGLAPTQRLSVHRRRPDGTRLEWGMVGLRGEGGAWPFFIDWQDAPHPSSDIPTVGPLLDFEARLPVDDVEALPFAGTKGVRLVAGAPRLAVVFESPRGVVEWSRDAPEGFFGDAGRASD